VIKTVTDKSIDIISEIFILLAKKYAMDILGIMEVKDCMVFVKRAKFSGVMNRRFIL
jgi:hypothetical protein